MSKKFTFQISAIVEVPDEACDLTNKGLEPTLKAALEEHFSSTLSDGLKPEDVTILTTPPNKG